MTTSNAVNKQSTGNVEAAQPGFIVQAAGMMDTSPAVASLVAGLLQGGDLPAPRSTGNPQTTAQSAPVQGDKVDGKTQTAEAAKPGININVGTSKSFLKKKLVGQGKLDWSKVPEQKLNDAWQMSKNGATDKAVYDFLQGTVEPTNKATPQQQYVVVSRTRDGVLNYNTLATGVTPVVAPTAEPDASPTVGVAQATS